MSDKPKLASQQQALGLYLRSLLTETPTVAPELQQVASLLERATQPKPEVMPIAPVSRPPVAPIRVQPNTPPPLEPAPQPQQPPVAPVIEVAKAPPAIPPVNADGVPLWAEDGFQSLFFEVAGLTLAVPLIKLGGIHAISEITALPKKPDWFKGLMRIESGENLRVVDTALWVMPEKYEQLAERLDYQYLIRLEHSPWALACTKVRDAVSLSPEQVKWRQSAGRRPWMSGMLIEQMCVLLEVDSLIELLGD